MGVLKATGGIFKSIFDVKSWLGYDQIKYQTKGTFSMIKPMLRVQKPAYTETFEEAMARLNLDEADLPRLIERYRLQVYLFSSFAGLSLLYMLYLLWNYHFFAGFVAFLIAALFITRACGAHFYTFQIKHRKLGCTLKEWLQGNITKET